jgi:hypothetical protein
VQNAAVTLGAGGKRTLAGQQPAAAVVWAASRFICRCWVSKPHLQRLKCVSCRNLPAQLQATPPPPQFHLPASLSLAMPHPMLTRHRSFCSQMRHLCNSVASSFPSGSRKFLFELQQLMAKAVDASPSTSAAAPSAALAGPVAAPATLLHSFTKTKTPPIGSPLPVSSSSSSAQSSQLLSPHTPSFSSSTRSLPLAAGDSAEPSLSFDLGSGGSSDFEGAGSSSAAGSTGGTVSFHADFFVSARQGEKLVRIFARESERLSMVPPQTRTAELRRSLQALSQRIPSNLYIPIFPHLYSRWRLVGIAVEQYVFLFSRPAAAIVVC